MHDVSNLTINPSSSTIKFTDTSSNAKTFFGASQTYNDFWITGSGTGDYTMTGSNTFNDFKDDNSVAHNVDFENGSTTTVSSFNVTGSFGNEISKKRMRFFCSHLYQSQCIPAFLQIISTREHFQCPILEKILFKL